MPIIANGESMSNESKVMAAAKDMPCIRCGNTHGVMARHYNGPRQHKYGKGRSIKCHWLMTAEFCGFCDEIFTEGSFFKFKKPENWASEWDRSEWFLHWIAETNIRREKNGVIKV